MHDSSYNSMADFVKKYLPQFGRVLDVGSMDVNGTYRELFAGRWEYVGLDVAIGKNVNLVPADQYFWCELKTGSFDAVISGQALEHIENDVAIVGEMFRVLKPGGHCCLIAPSTGPEHGYPKDYRRYTEASLKALAEAHGFTVLESYTDTAPMWRDVVVVAKKIKK